MECQRLDPRCGLREPKSGYLRGNACNLNVDASHSSFVSFLRHVAPAGGSSADTGGRPVEFSTGGGIAPRCIPPCGASSRRRVPSLFLLASHPTAHSLLRRLTHSFFVHCFPELDAPFTVLSWRNKPDQFKPTLLIASQPNQTQTIHSLNNCQPSIYPSVTLQSKHTSSSTDTEITSQIQNQKWPSSAKRSSRPAFWLPSPWRLH